MRITIQFGDLFARLRKIAIAERQPIASIVRNIVSDYLNQESNVSKPGNPNFKRNENENDN